MLSIATNGLPAVKVVRPGRFGNHHTLRAVREAGYLGDDEALARMCVQAFRDDWEADLRRGIDRGIGYLKGKNLACWCRPEAPCHADVLLDLANRG